MTEYEFWSLIIQGGILLAATSVPIWGIWRMDQKAEKRYSYWDEQSKIMQDQSKKSDAIMAALKESTDMLRAINEREPA